MKCVASFNHRDIQDSNKLYSRDILVQLPTASALHNLASKNAESFDTRQLGKIILDKTEWPAIQTLLLKGLQAQECRHLHIAPTTETVGFWIERDDTDRRCFVFFCHPDNKNRVISNIIEYHGRELAKEYK